MKNNKKGISLIVLVITILVIIVLAGAVILTVSQNNPLDNANKANMLSDRANVQNAVILYYSQNATTDKISTEGLVYLPLVNGNVNGAAQVVTREEFIAATNGLLITDEGFKAVETRMPAKDGLSWNIDSTGKVFMVFANGKVPKWAKDDKGVITYDYIIETPAP